MSKDENVVTITEMDANGRFTCPKCKVEVDPDLEEEYVILENVVNEAITIRHKCGQILKIEMEGVSC